MFKDSKGFQVIHHSGARGRYSIGSVKADSPSVRTPDRSGTVSAQQPPVDIAQSARCTALRGGGSRGLRRLDLRRMCRLRLVRSLVVSLDVTGQVDGHGLLSARGARRPPVSMLSASSVDGGARPCTPSRRRRPPPLEWRHPARRHRQGGRRYRGGAALAVAERATDGLEPDTVHDSLRRPCMAAVVDAKAGESGVLPYGDPEGIESVRGQVFGEYPFRALGPGQIRDQPCGVRPEPDRTRPGLGVFKPGACAVFHRGSALRSPQPSVG